MSGTNGSLRVRRLGGENFLTSIHCPPCAPVGWAAFSRNERSRDRSDAAQQGHSDGRVNAPLMAGISAVCSVANEALPLSGLWPAT